MTKYWILALLAVVGCGEPEPATSVGTAEVNGIEGMFEYSIDLPWRLEPRMTASGVRYDPIPITLAIFDDDTNHYSSDFQLGSLCRFSMASVDPDGEHGTRVMHTPSELAWIEVTGPDPDDRTRPTWWPWDDPRDPWHGVCHPGSENCEAFEKITNTSEWQAQFMFPLQGRPGFATTFELIMWVSRDDRSCDDSFLDDMLQLRSFARVTFAREPLPRFTDESARADDDRWLYGDLHYHSQGTDNEGETGYAYRAVATTLAAMGVDFAFATDHASDSEQIVSVGGLLSGIESRGLRDMNLRRWNAGQQYLHAPDGANAEGAQFAADHSRMPRVFLGGEIDVMPEVPVAAHGPSDPAWLVHYGNGQWWDMLSTSGLCDGFPTVGCPVEDRAFTPFTDENGDEAYVVNDLQGILGWKPGRQHLVYFPRFVDEPQGFVGSRTTTWGGASRHLVEDFGVLDEVASKHGIAFLAHPLAAGGESFGPGMLPYTQYQYEKVFAHPGLAGLQLWNDDVRVVSDTNDWGQTGYDFLSATSPGNFVPGWKTGDFTFTPVAHLGGWTWSRAASPASQLFNGTSQWDRLLRWGLDLERTRAIGWLPSGEPRRLFMAGGSDAHGDFNYRREGYLRGPTRSTDDALAKVRNLIEVGAPRGPCSAIDGKCHGLDPTAPGHSQDQVVEALAEGHFSVTDGPALRIVVDRNRNGKIDDSDTPMGGVLDLFPGEQLPLLVEAKTSPEFWPLASIDLYVGVDHDAEAVCGEPGCADGSTGEQRARTYAPENHGVRGVWRENVDGNLIPDLPAQNCGPGVCEMADHYWMPATAARSKLRADPASVAAGLWEVTIDPDQFPVNSTRDSRPTRLYVRAFARTLPPPPSQGGCLFEFPTGHFHQDCVERFAYTNPIWALRQPSIAGECPLSNRALDRDGDGLPDSCDLFPDEPASGGWTRAFGGSNSDAGLASAMDSQGNVYVVGAVRAVNAGTAIHIEGALPADAQFTAEQDDAVVLKYNRAGQLVKRNVLHGAGTQVISDITISGDVIHIAGTRKQQTVIDGVVTMSQSIDPFVARINTTDLRVEWIRFIEGTGDASTRAVAANASGQVVVVGDFSGQLASFQPGVVAEGASDCFIAYYKVNQTTPPPPPSTPPQLQSIQVVSGNGTCAARDVAIDSAGRATAVYDFTNVVRPSSSIVRTTSGTDSIVVRYGAFAQSFTPQWGTTIGSASAGESDRGDASTNALAIGLDGTTFIAGSFDGWLAVNGSLRRPSAGGRDGFIVHLASNGTILPSPMLSVAGTSDDDAVTSLDIDGNGRLLIAGTFESTSVSLNALSLVRQGAIRNAFVAWVDAAGTASSVHQYNDLVTFTRAVVSFDGTRAALASMFTNDARYDSTRVVPSRGGQDGALTLIPEAP